MSDNFIRHLPQRFVRNTLALCGESGERWLINLPQIIEILEKKWSLSINSVFPNLSYNFVASCICLAGNEAVLKIALPLNNPEIYNEAQFLKLSDGNGTVKILQSDEDSRAILLEKLTPGSNLKEVCRLEQAKAVEITIQIMRRIARKPPPDFNFPRLEDWFNNFRKAESTAFDKNFFAKSFGYFEELSSAAKQKYLIHGDLHHENILSATRAPFLAIDPKGIIGDTGYEIAVFLNNHALWLASDREQNEKLIYAVEQFSEAFEIEARDLCKWAYAQMTLSAWWTFEDNDGDWKSELNRAQMWENTRF